MFEKFLEGFISQKLGNYIEGLNSDQLKLGIWRGDLAVTNLILKSTALIELGLQYIISHSYIGKLSFHIPWKSINNTPCQIDIEEMDLVIHPTSKGDNQYFDASDLFSQQYIIMNDNLYKFKTNTFIDGIVNNLFTKVIENIKFNLLEIKILIIFPKYSLGIDFQQLSVYNVDEQDQEIFFDRFLQRNQNQHMQKNIKIQQIGLYKLLSFDAFQKQNIRKYDYLANISLKMVQISQNNRQLIYINNIDIKQLKEQSYFYTNIEQFYQIINEIINHQSRTEIIQKLTKQKIIESADQNNNQFVFKEINKDVNRSRSRSREKKENKKQNQKTNK